ncbi:unnamed protein product [Aspergillus oryzae]|uniref:Unnamed protein product n=2 Tax=Aspergillus oryzae TaxID=5062 RepID=A0AAN5C2E7_ASPOZ|nr:unnamed protein product [Aspergillus oryzae]GMF92756.1 unnamed protein product [Aspergillus oryzae]GMG08732.1 unnamed protein product [Aspergillus oryzae]GMG36962.1 unnamed protein product [Aspergillus oryzae]GMG49506.1 unnamed protein product [Aspergillus oryzae var. brunneus]
MADPYVVGRVVVQAVAVTKMSGNEPLDFKQSKNNNFISNRSESTGVRAAAPGPVSAAAKQVRTYAAEAKASPTEVSSILEQRIRGVQEEAGLAETGRVLSVGYVVNSSEMKILDSATTPSKIIENIKIINSTNI